MPTLPDKPISSGARLGDAQSRRKVSLLRRASMIVTLALIASACVQTSSPQSSGKITALLEDDLSIVFTGNAPANTPFEIEVKNAGVGAHNLAIDINGKTLETHHLGADQQTTFAVPALAPGQATFYCAIPGHREGGMHASLQIGSAGPSATSDEGMTAEQMDEMHAAGIAAFPAKTEGLGGQPLKPEIVDGVKIFRLTTSVVQWEVSPGELVEAFAYNGVVPGPEIRVRKGDRVRVILKNEMPESTSIHFHGVIVPNAMDGVPFITQDPVLTGETFTYQFTVKNEPGTHMYHSHHNSTEQVGKGLLGAFIVEPRRRSWDAEATIVVGDGPLGFTINGKGFPATAPIASKRGDRLLLRFMNEGQMLHPMHLHGFPLLVIAMDGYPLAQPMKLDTVVVAPGQRVDAIAVTDIPGTWALHCHILGHAESEEGMFGMVTAVVVA